MSFPLKTDASNVFAKLAYAWMNWETLFSMQERQ